MICDGVYDGNRFNLSKLLKTSMNVAFQPNTPLSILVFRFRDFGTSPAVKVK